MSELVVSPKCEFESNAESFDRHNGDRSHSGADRDEYQRISLAILWRDIVDHNCREDDDRKTI